MTVDPAAADAAPLLGYKDVSPADIGLDILPAIGLGSGGDRVHASAVVGPDLACGHRTGIPRRRSTACASRSRRCPEPAPALLLALGLGCLLALHRRITTNA